MPSARNNKGVLAACETDYNGDAMNQFIQKYSNQVAGVLSCFDRLIFKGHLPIGYAAGMEKLLGVRKLLIKDFKQFAPAQAERLKQHAKAMAEKQGRPYIYLDRKTPKEEQAQKIARQQGVTQGLVCVFATLEKCPGFKIAYGQKRPRLVAARRTCLCLYFYYIDQRFGLMHIRLQTWFPMSVQIYINGHEYLARQLDREHVAYTKCDNAFLSIADFAVAQRLANGLKRKNWPRILEAFARMVNPLLGRGELFDGLRHYWVTDQSEFATDVIFRDPEGLQPLYETWLRHAVLSFGAEDVLGFLGRTRQRLCGEVRTEYKRRWPGARVKHWVNQNWIKMYRKADRVLRIETVVNQPRGFKVRRTVTRRGCTVTGWFPMNKGVAYLWRHVEVGLAANRRYLDALAAASVLTLEASEQLRQLAEPLRRQGRSVRPFNPASAQDIALFRSLLRGENLLQGLRNGDVRTRLYGLTADPQQARRQSAQVTRLLQRFHARRLLAKIPRSRRWRLTLKGQLALSAAVQYHDQHYPESYAAIAA